MSERLNSEQGEEQVAASGLLLSVEPIEGSAEKLHAQADSDDTRDGTADSDGTDTAGDNADKADGDGTDGSDGDGTDGGGGTDAKDSDGTDGADVSTDSDGVDA